MARSSTPDWNDPDAKHPRTPLEVTTAAAGPGSGALAATADALAARAAMEKPGDQIGPFTIQKVLGEGGFGVVYLAERREPMVQRVALKVIKPGMDTRAVVSRFEQERQALAMMDHPGVARVLDAGATPAGRPYFAMEFVNGEPITEYCDRRTLGTRERLGLFAQVCEAVQHAHMRGIIHRDLKPSNVLVVEGAGPGGAPLAKVIDFGIAKAISHAALGRTVFTEHGQLIGTPEYMSPEQADARTGDIDTRTDVYSLGVLLYELLVGTLPFDPSTLRSAGYAEIQRIIREVDPPRPSTRLSQLGEAATEAARRRRVDPEAHRRELHRELEWIPLKAMRKDRSQRYRSPAELADDVRNYLDGRPLIAGPESAAYRASKFVRRHKAAVVAGVVLAAGAGLGVAGVGVGYVRATAAAASEHAAREDESAARQRADATRRFLMEMLASVDPEKAKGREPTVRDMLDQAAGKVGAAMKDDGEGEAALRQVIGQTYHQLGRYQEALTQLTLAADLDEKRLGPDHKETLTDRHNLGAAYASLGRLEEARQAFQRAYDGRLATQGPHAEDTLASLSMLGYIAQVTGDAEGALKLYRQVHEEQKTVLGPKSKGALETLASIADVLQDLGRLEEAEKAAGELAGLSREAAPADGGGPEGAQTLQAMSIRASILRDLSRFEDAERLCREVLAARRRIYGPDHASTLTTENVLAQTLEQLKRYDEAAELTRHAATVAARDLGEANSATLSYLANLGRIEQLRGKLPEAEAIMRRVLDARLKESGPEAQQTLAVMNNLALLLLDMKKPAEAEATFRAMLVGVEKTMPPDHWIRGQARVNLGECLSDQGRFAEAETAMLEGWAQLARVLKPGHSRLKTAAEGIAKMYRAWGNQAKADEWAAK